MTDLLPYELTLRSPMATAHAIVERRRGLLLGLGDGEHTGWGDLCPMPGWSTHAIDELLDELVEVLFSDEPSPERLEPWPEARAGFVGALYDLAAQEAGRSLAAHLAPEPLERVAVNATISAVDVATALTTVNLALASGITTVKLKVAHRRPEADLALVEGTRRALGDDGEIRLDANGGWTPEEAVAALNAAEPFGVALCEEPTGGIDAIAAVGEAVSVPVAADESMRSLEDLDAVLATGSIGFVVIKPQAFGGPDLAMAAIERARASGVTPIVTSMIDSAIGVAHAVHVAAASGVDIAHGLATSALLASDVGTPLPVIDGWINVPDRPGLGVRPSQPSR